MTQPQNRSSFDTGDLPPAVDGERLTYEIGQARVNCYTAGQGGPLLLLHSINAAASAYEIKPAVDVMQYERTVYALDLPGFGTSSRGDIDYSIEFYVETIVAAVSFISQRHDGAPVDVLGLSLTCEFMARAALRQPELFRSLLMVTPTGFETGAHKRRDTPGSTAELPVVKTVVSVKPIGKALFGLLVSRPSVSFFLKRTFGSSQVDPGLVDYAYRSAHQPGAAHAPLAFVSGRLFAKDIRNLYEELSLPVWLAYGTKGAFSNFDEADWVRNRPNWAESRFETGAFPHFQAPRDFFTALRRFLSAIPTQAEVSERGMAAPQSAMMARQAG